ncbi:MAG: acyl-ACP--UDP-N-acetylglucosamine O-acyltransferase [Candidatus Symbiobacter sp.]|nr:acyl-ACP--UDP-N-acetylglucosamine O-acyltransferase [Candidatus Symbiobacter sp.]
MTNSQRQIHPTAIIDPTAILGEAVEIGPFAVIGGGVVLGNGVKIYPHAVVMGDTNIGDHTEIFPFSAIGLAPQDKKYQGEKTRLVIGQHCVIREHCTFHPGTKTGTGITLIGNHGLFMVNTHIAHDCRVGDHVIMANNVTLGGHVTIGNHAILGGISAYHQHSQVGEYAMVGGMTGVESDVIPFGLVMGDRASLRGLNIIGLKRREERGEISRDTITALRQAYRMIFEENDGTMMQRLSLVSSLYAQDASVMAVVDFIQSPGRPRQLCLPQRRRHDKNQDKDGDAAANGVNQGGVNQGGIIHGAGSLAR